MQTRTPIAPGFLTAPSFSAPITIDDAAITANGSNVFTGNWARDTYSNAGDATRAAVFIATTQPVIIENSIIRGQNDCIASVLTGTNVTVRNCVGLSCNTLQSGSPSGRFVSLHQPESVVVENNSISGGSGIYTDGSAPGGTTVYRVRFNRMRNVDGRLSDGAGGFVLERANVVNAYFLARLFLQVNVGTFPNGAEIAWNEIINDPFVSRPEDNFNITSCVGTVGTPVRFHDNFVRGGCPSRPYDVITWSGSGFMIEGATSKYIDIDDNQIVGLANVGIGIPECDSNINVRRNRLVSAGNAYGRAMLARNRAAYSSDAGATYIVWQDNAYSWVDASNNQVGLWITNGGNTGNVNTGWTSLGAPTTEAHEAAEWEYWRAKVAAAGVRLGSTLAV